MTGRLDVGGIALAILAMLEAKAAFYQWSIPERRYVSVGPEALDCVELTVGLGRVPPGLPETPSVDRMLPTTVFSAQFLVTVTREWPIGSSVVPSPEALTAAAVTVMADATFLLRAFTDAVAEGLLDTCRTVAPQPIGYIGPEGGMIGTMLPIVVQL